MSATSLQLTALGHGSFSLSVPTESGIATVVINPETGMRAPDGPVQYILLSHYSLSIWDSAKHLAEQHKATIVVASDFSNWVRSLEPTLETIPLTTDGEVELAWGSVVLTESHYEYRLPNGTTQPGNGFILKALNNVIYYSGPATFSPELRTIGAVYFPNAAILACGPELATPEETARNVMWLGSDLVFPIFQGLNDKTAEDFQHEVFVTLDTFTPAICRILEPGQSYPLMPVESSGRQAGPEARY